MNGRLAAVFAALALNVGSFADLDEALVADLDAAINAEIRSDAERGRDANRRPKQTLEFFGIERDMTVIEIFPGGGWYAKLLVPALREKGSYVAIGGLGKALGFGEILGPVKNLEGFEDVKIVDISGAMSPSGERGGYMNMSAVDFRTKNADRVLTFRNLHNLTASARANMYAAAFAALKRGGKFGVIDHTRRHMQARTNESWRRLDPVLIVKEITGAGFEFSDFSTLHHRPDDELRYEVGRRSVTGNTDRFTLLFTKP